MEFKQINKELIKPLPKKKIEYSEWYMEKYSSRIPVIERVLFFNPKKLYKQIAYKFDPYKRHAGIQMDDLFPKTEGKCACGCKKEPKSGLTWQHKWAHPDCATFASDVLSIINSYFGKPAYYIKIYAGNICSECPETHDLELDHIVGVKHGGGGSWLSNYRWLCKTCHRKKTNRDFNFKNAQTPEIF